MNRNKLIDLFASNLATAIVHQILELAINQQEYIDKYNKEFKNSWQIASDYRRKINPVDRLLPDKDTEEIKNIVVNKVNSELNLRIEKGYKNINLSLVEKFVHKALKELKIAD